LVEKKGSTARRSVAPSIPEPAIRHDQAHIASGRRFQPRLRRRLSRLAWAIVGVASLGRHREPPAGRHGAADQPQRALVVDAAAQEVEAAHERGDQGVEVVCDAAL